MNVQRPQPGGNAEAVMGLQIERWLEAAACGLTQEGWFCDVAAVPTALVDHLRSDLAELIDSERLERAGIGREADFALDGTIRSDRIFWLTRARPRQAALLDEAERLRLALNRRLFLALFEFEAHLALYRPGAFYRRHYDSFRDAASRVVSLVIYLNDWQPGDGGELLLYRDGVAAPFAVIEPRAGTLVLFLSEEIPHEVLETRVPRASVSGWYRLNTSTTHAIDPPR